MWFFSSDHHFDHSNIIDYTGRPFTNVNDMNDHLIRLWNATVRGGDTVVYAGDFTLYHKEDDVMYKFARHLNGNIIFLKGNHDYWLKGPAASRYLYHKKINGQQIATSHYPMRSWHGMRHGGWNLHGHTHALMAPLERQLDIGVDNAFKLLGQYRPFAFVEVAHFITKNLIAQFYDDNDDWFEVVCIDPTQVYNLGQGTWRSNFLILRHYYAQAVDGDKHPSSKDTYYITGKGKLSKAQVILHKKYFKQCFTPVLGRKDI